MLEPAQQRQIHRDAKKQRAPRPPAQPQPVAEVASQPEIEHHGGQNQDDTDWIPPAVKKSEASTSQSLAALAPRYRDRRPNRASKRRQACQQKGRQFISF